MCGRFSGQKHAQILSNAGLNVTVIPDSAIFAIMARVNKVIIGTHAGKVRYVLPVEEQEIFPICFVCKF